MAEFGKFSEITFINGTSPPINADNLNELERVVALADQELARSDAVKFSEWTQYFYERNTKVLYYFSDYSDWSNSYPANVSLSDEEDDNIIGNECLKMEIINAAGGNMSIYQTMADSVNLTEFYDGSSSGVDDVIVILFYLSDGAAVDNLEFRFGDDFSNCYWIDVFSGSTGWNAIYPQKSDFTTIGAPTGWNDITYLRIAPHATAGYSGEYYLFQYFELVRQDPVYSGYSNPFQKYMGAVSGWVNLFSIISDVCLLYRDHQDFIEKIGFMKVDGENVAIELKIFNEVIEFISKFEFYCKEAGESASITWYYNSTNFAEVYISSDTFYLDVTEAGVKTATSKALDNGLIKNERFYIYFEKEEDTFRAILLKDGEAITILEYETSISSSADGDIYIGQYADDSFSFLTDFQIGHRPINHLDRELLPRYVKMYKEQELVNNTTTDILGLVAKLAPFSIYAIDLYLIVTSPTTGKDIKISWELTGVTNLTQRGCMGPPVGMATAADTNIICTEYATGTSVEYGVNSGNETYIHEHIIVLSTNSGGEIQIRGAQAVTDGGNPTVVKTRSHMIITPIDAKAHTNI